MFAFKIQVQVCVQTSALGFRHGVQVLPHVKRMIRKSKHIVLVTSSILMAKYALPFSLCPHDNNRKDNVIYAASNRLQQPLRYRYNHQHKINKLTNYRKDIFHFLQAQNENAYDNVYMCPHKHHIKYFGKNSQILYSVYYHKCSKCCSKDISFNFHFNSTT